ncbi:hypothetical protein GCM10010219_55190 [Streptomyces netropsis]|nr:hypothetical protein GCM10010219_55190 [Streptomyces netropsis]
MPAPSYVAPRGYACPGHTCMSRLFHFFRGVFRGLPEVLRRVFRGESPGAMGRREDSCTRPTRNPFPTDAAERAFPQIFPKRRPAPPSCAPFGSSNRVTAGARAMNPLTSATTAGNNRLVRWDS